MDNEGQVIRRTFQPANPQDNRCKVTWTDVDNCVRYWLPHIPKYDVIVGVAYGGLFLASLLAKIQNTHLSTMYLKYYDEDNSQFTDGVQYYGFWGRLSGKILIVDDIADTGRTLKKAISILDGADSLTMFQKPGSLIKPKFVYANAEGWVEFPWEQYDTNGKEIKRGTNEKG